MTNYQELKRLAEAATAGPWIAGNDDDSDYYLVGPVAFDRIVTHPVVKLHNERNADYIAAASPDAVLSMIAEIDRLRLHIKHIGNDALRTQNQALVEALKKLQARLDPCDYPDEQKECRAALAQAEGGV